MACQTLRLEINVFSPDTESGYSDTDWLLAELQPHVLVTRSSETQQMLSQAQNSSCPRTIVILDHAIHQAAQDLWLRKWLVHFVRVLGGTLLIWCRPRIDMDLTNVDMLLCSFELPWRPIPKVNYGLFSVNHASQVSSELVVNKVSMQQLGGVVLQDVELEHRLYSDSGIAEPVTPAAVSSIGSGRVGFVGHMDGSALAALAISTVPFDRDTGRLRLDGNHPTVPEGRRLRPKIKSPVKEAHAGQQTRALAKLRLSTDVKPSLEEGLGSCSPTKGLRRSKRTATSSANRPARLRLIRGLKAVVRKPTPTVRTAAPGPVESAVVEDVASQGATLQMSSSEPDGPLPGPPPLAEESHRTTIDEGMAGLKMLWLLGKQRGLYTGEWIGSIG